jgi:DNA-binding NarL/FixJ family response regulator
VVLLHIHMPGNGIPAAREVSAALPQSVVVMLTQSRDESDLSHAPRRPVPSGYLMQDINPIG